MYFWKNTPQSLTQKVTNRKFHLLRPREQTTIPSQDCWVQSDLLHCAIYKAPAEVLPVGPWRLRGTEGQTEGHYLLRSLGTQNQNPPGLVPYACNPSTWKGDTRSEVQGSPQPQCKFEASLGHMRPRLKQIKTLTKTESPKPQVEKQSITENEEDRVASFYNILCPENFFLKEPGVGQQK